MAPEASQARSSARAALLGDPKAHRSRSLPASDGTVCVALRVLGTCSSTHTMERKRCLSQARRAWNPGWGWHQGQLARAKSPASQRPLPLLTRWRAPPPSQANIKLPDRKVAASMPMLQQKLKWAGSSSLARGA